MVDLLACNTQLDCANDDLSIQGHFDRSIHRADPKLTSQHILYQDCPKEYLSLNSIFLSPYLPLKVHGEKIPHGQVRINQTQVILNHCAILQDTMDPLVL